MVKGDDAGQEMNVLVVLYKYIYIFVLNNYLLLLAEGVHTKSIFLSLSGNSPKGKRKLYQH